MTVQRMALLALVPAVGGFDLWVVASRCPLSPPLHSTATLVACALQVIAIGLPILVERRFDTETARFRVRGAVIAVVCFLFSMPLFETAVLYGDSIGQGKGYRSVGLRCHGHARWFRDGP